MIRTIEQFVREDEGLTMVEYAIAGSLVGLACVLAFTTLGETVGAAIQSMIQAMGGTPTGPTLGGAPAP